MNLIIEQITNLSELTIAMNLVESVFMEFEAPEYSQEGIQTFLDYISISNIKEKIEQKELSVWCAKLEKEIVGVIAMRPPNAISLLFVDKEHHKKGIAKTLFHYILNHYPINGTTITVNSSPYAVEIYRRLGFIELDSEQIKDGIRFYPMIYLNNK